MKSIKTCPHCGLEVAFEQHELATTLCPRCELPIDRVRVVSSPPPGPKSAVSGATVVLFPVNGAVNGLQPVRLSAGRHILGRKSARSNATVQFDTQDFFMSKRHSQLDISAGADGMLHVIVADAGSANGTFVNERRLDPGERVEVYSGDSIRLGSTQFTLQ